MDEEQKELSLREIEDYADTKIQGVFDQENIRLLKEELDKLEVGQIYVEIGVDEGKSFYVAHKLAKPGIIRIGIDINDPGEAFANGEKVSIGRRDFFKEEGIVGLEKYGLYVHGDADIFAKIFKQPFVDLIFIDGFHNYESVRKNVDMWLPLMKPGSTMLFHDYIDSNSDGVKPVVDETFGDKAELIGEMARVRL
ncbi:MAG: class I SAM-dependent methyltransferase [Actinomycetota bacterium]